MDTPTCTLEADALVFLHSCKGKDREERLPLAEDYWSVKQTEADLSVSPSIHCNDCGLHGYWNHDRWITA